MDVKPSVWSVEFDKVNDTNQKVSFEGLWQKATAEIAPLIGSDPYTVFDASFMSDSLRTCIKSVYNGTVFDAGIMPAGGFDRFSWEDRHSSEALWWKVEWFCLLLFDADILSRDLAWENFKTVTAQRRRTVPKCEEFVSSCDPIPGEGSGRKDCYRLFSLCLDRARTSDRCPMDAINPSRESELNPRDNIPLFSWTTNSGADLFLALRQFVLDVDADPLQGGDEQDARENPLHFYVDAQRLEMFRWDEATMFEPLLDGVDPPFDKSTDADNSRERISEVLQTADQLNSTYVKNLLPYIMLIRSKHSDRHLKSYLRDKIPCGMMSNYAEGIQALVRDISERWDPSRFFLVPGQKLPFQHFQNVLFPDTGLPDFTTDLPALQSKHLLAFLHIKARGQEGGVIPEDGELGGDAASFTITADDIIAVGGTVSNTSGEWNIFQAYTELFDPNQPSPAVSISNLTDYLALDIDNDGVVSFAEIRQLGGALVPEPVFVSQCLRQDGADDSQFEKSIVSIDLYSYQVEFCMQRYEVFTGFDSNNNSEVDLQELQWYMQSELCHGEDVNPRMVDEWVGKTTQLPVNFDEYELARKEGLEMPTSLVVQVFLLVDSDMDGLLSSAEVEGDVFGLLSTTGERRQGSGDDVVSLRQVLTAQISGVADTFATTDADDDGKLDAFEIEQHIQACDVAGATAIERAAPVLTLRQYLGLGGGLLMEEFCSQQVGGLVTWVHVADRLPIYERTGLWDGQKFVADDREKAWRKGLIEPSTLAETGFDFATYRLVTTAEYQVPLGGVKKVTSIVLMTTVSIGGFVSPLTTVGAQHLGFLGADCDGELEDVPRWDASPVEWAIGSSGPRYYTGGALFAVLLFVGIFLLHVLTAGVFALCKRWSLAKAAHKCKVSYSFIAVLMIVAEPIGQLGTVALTDMDGSAADRVIGVVVMLLFIAVFAVMQYKVFCAANFSRVKMSQCDAKDLAKQCFVVRQGMPTAQWMVEDVADDGSSVEVGLVKWRAVEKHVGLWWVMKGAPLYVDYSTRFRFWIAMEMMLSFLLGVCEALTPFLGCIAATSVMASLLLIHTLFTFIARPFLIPVDRIMYFIISPLMMIAGFLKLAFVVKHDEDLADAMENIILLLAMLLLLRALLDALVCIQKVLSILKLKLKAPAKERCETANTTQQDVPVLEDIPALNLDSDSEAFEERPMERTERTLDLSSLYDSL